MKSSENNSYEVIIIGAGIIGGAAARELSRYKTSILCLEKEADVCCGVSKANTGIIHSPAFIPSGKLKSEMNAKGAVNFDRLSAELGFRYQKTGALLLSFSSEDRHVLEKYKKTGIENYNSNGIVPADYRVIEGEELFDMEPALNRSASAALFAPDAGRIIPYEYGIALWENAVANGVHLKLGQNVTGVRKKDDGTGWKVQAGKEEYSARFIVNAAGHGSNAIGLDAGFNESRINRVKGQYLIMKRNSGPEVNTILFQVPGEGEAKKGKGILVTRTVYGNLMIGPDAVGQDSADDTSTDIKALSRVVEGARLSVPAIDPSECIKTFAGVRPRPASGDFIITKKDSFIHLCGIESPGITSSPAIAARIVEMLKEEGFAAGLKSDFNPERKPLVRRVLSLPPDEVKQRIALPPGAPERLVCRCEQVPEPRILDALSRGIEVKTIDGVKRRTRAGQGMCQGGFCGSRVKELIASYYQIPEDKVSQRGFEPELERVSAAEVRKLYK